MKNGNGRCITIAFYKNWGIPSKCSTESTICLTRKVSAYFNGLVLPHLDYVDVVWGDQPGLTTQMKQLQSFQNRIAKKISKGKRTSAEALTSLQWVPLHARRFGHRCCLVHARCNERRDPRTS